MTKFEFIDNPNVVIEVEDFDAPELRKSADWKEVIEAPKLVKVPKNDEVPQGTGVPKNA